MLFWKNSTLYNSFSALNTLINNYGQSIGSAINIFISSPQGSTGGYVRWIGDNTMLLFKPYYNYAESVTYNNCWYNRSSAILINHEIGHCLDLYHTILTNSGICKNDWDDLCDDTPTIQQMLDLSKPDPCCWNDTHCSNNLMDYNAGMQSITPDQLNRIHSALNSEKLNYIECNYEIINKSINSFGPNSGAFVAKTINVSGTSAVITNGKTIYLEADEINLNSGFEVQQGGKLFVLLNSNCN